MILLSGETFLEEVSKRMNSDVYINLLKNKGLPFIKECARGDFIFQQDNCAIHVSKKSKQFFQNEEIKLLEWPS
jgi:hypothetical protein